MRSNLGGPGGSNESRWVAAASADGWLRPRRMGGRGPGTATEALGLRLIIGRSEHMLPVQCTCLYTCPCLMSVHMSIHMSVQPDYGHVHRHASDMCHGTIGKLSSTKVLAY